MLAVGGNTFIALSMIAVSTGISWLLLFYNRRPHAFILFCLLISLFGPPTLVLHHPLEMAGLSVLPVYIVSVFIVVFYIVISLLRERGFRLQPLLYLGFLWSVALVTSFTGLDPAHSLKKCVILALCMVIYCAFTCMGGIIREEWRVSLLCIVVIVFFQLYQGITSIGFVDDNFFWFRFESLQWLRFGAGYHGNLFNPPRLYAMFYNPNYIAPVIIILLLAVISSQADIGSKNMAFFLAVFSILATLSLQGILIGLIIAGLHLSTRTRIKIFSERITLVSLFFLVPLFLILLHLLVNPETLPNPYSSSIAERTHILAASAKAFAENPMGIGLGNFTKYGSLFYTETSKKIAVAHGWHYELLIHLGLFGYLAFSQFFLDIYGRINYHGKLALWAVFFWGLTSPGLLIWYLWLSLGLISGVFKKSAGEINRDLGIGRK